MPPMDVLEQTIQVGICGDSRRSHQARMGLLHQGSEWGRGTLQDGGLTHGPHQGPPAKHLLPRQPMTEKSHHQQTKGHSSTNPQQAQGEGDAQEAEEGCRRQAQFNPLQVPGAEASLDRGAVSTQPNLIPEF